jgi:phospholipid/cholesterol/gamma-HCH transport system permease protein
MQPALAQILNTPPRVGYRTARFLCRAVDVAALLAGALAAAAVPRHWSRSTRLRLVEHIYRCAVEPLLITLFVAIITGLVLSFQVAEVTQSIGQPDAIGRYLVLLHVREVGPVLVNLIIIGCVGATIAHEIGTLARRGALDRRPGDADPMVEQVMPRVLGVAVGALCLKILFDLAGLISGYALTRGIGLTQLPASLYLREIIEALQALDIVMILTKTVLPAMVTVAIACIVGRHLPRRGQAAQRDALPAVFGGSVFALFSITVLTTAAAL